MSRSIPDSLLALLDRWRTEKPEQVAVIEYDVYASRAAGAPVLRNAVTWGSLWETAIAFAAVLRSRGVGADDIVAIQLPTWHEYLAAHLAANFVGAVTMPISPIYRHHEMARQLELSRAKVLLVPAEYGHFDYLAMAADLRAAFPSLGLVVSVGERRSPGCEPWSELVSQGGGAAHAAAREAIASGRHALTGNAFMLLNFTSGTTGEPKGVKHSISTIYASVARGADRMELGSDEAIFVAVTLGHAAGFLNGMYMPLLLGAKAVYMDLWDPSVALDVIEKEQVTYGPAMPTYLFDLADHPRFTLERIASWRTSRVSGGAIARPLMATLQQRLPHLRLCPGWGMSEVLYVTCGSPQDTPEKRNLTEGRPLEGFGIQIRDATFREQRPAGQSGEIVIRTPSQMLGYYGQEALTRAAYTDDGWMKTGDLGFLDAEGYLTVVGRSKDLIIRGGENVPVVELEQMLMEHAKVATAVMIGVPDSRLGEKVCAVVECRDHADPLTFEEMQAFLLERKLTKQFIPQYLVLRDDLPRTGIGKVKKAELRKQVIEQLALA